MQNSGERCDVTRKINKQSLPLIIYIKAPFHLVSCAQHISMHFLDIVSGFQPPHLLCVSMYQHLALKYEVNKISSKLILHPVLT